MKKGLIEKCKSFYSKNKNKESFKAGVIFVGFIIILLGLLDGAGILPITPFKGTICFIVFVIAILFILQRIYQKTGSEVFIKLRNAFLFAGAVELLLCQWHSFHLFGGDYPQRTLDFSQAQTVNFDTVVNQNIDSGAVSLTFDDINIPVGTVNFDFDAPNSAIKDITIDIKDDTHSASYRISAVSARVIRGNERSKSVVCNLSGNVHSMCFRFYPSDNEIVTLKSITLNAPINVSFSLVRMAVLLILYFCTAMLVNSAWGRKSIEENKRSFSVCAYCITAVFVAFALLIANLGRYGDPNHSLKKDFTSKSGNQITQEIVDAFEDGRTYINDSPSEELLALENPYDWSQRDGIAYPWDHLLFDGKIYSYYGIAPVLVLFLPYHKLTGYYFPTVWAVWIFGCLGMLFLTKLYLYFMRRFFPKMQTSPVICGLVIMQLITGVWFCFCNPLFYEIAQISGFVCLTSGAYFLLSANILGKEGKISLWRLALSATCMSLGVLSRPTLAVYCVAAMFFLWLGLKKYMSANEKNKKASAAKFIVCSLLPYVLLGGLQMWYNYVRFGSPTDFGIQYSLTINDFTQSQFHWHFVIITLYNYIMAIPDFNIEFPFFDCSAVETFYPQGYYFVATYSAFGLLWKALPLFSYAKGVQAYRQSACPQKRQYTMLLVIVCILCPFIVMFSVWESGYGARYCVDFAWQMLIGALVIAFIVYQKCSENMRRHLMRVMAASTLICFIIVFGQTYLWVRGSLTAPLQSMLYSFARLFEVWR